MTDPYGELIRVAAELARGVGFPSPYECDWQFHKTTGPVDRRKVLRAAELTEIVCKELAQRIRGAADSLRAADTTNPKSVAP